MKTFTFSEEHFRVIASALVQLPYHVAAPVIQELERQDKAAAEAASATTPAKSP
jgi:hypothetical protein